MTSQLSLFAPRPPPAEPLLQHPRPPPDPWRGFAGLDEIFTRRSEEEWARVRARKAELAAGAAAKPAAEPEPMQVESPPPPAVPAAVPEPAPATAPEPAEVLGPETRAAAENRAARVRGSKIVAAMRAGLLTRCPSCREHGVRCLDCDPTSHVQAIEEEGE